MPYFLTAMHHAMAARCRPRAAVNTWTSTEAYSSPNHGKDEVTRMDLHTLISLRNFAVLLAVGILHFCQIPAMMAMYPKMLGWKDDIRPNSTAINRRIVMVISLAIMIAVIGLGVVVICTADELVSHSRLATALTGRS